MAVFENLSNEQIAVIAVLLSVLLIFLIFCACKTRPKNRSKFEKDKKGKAINESTRLKKASQFLVAYLRNKTKFAKSPKDTMTKGELTQSDTIDYEADLTDPSKS